MPKKIEYILKDSQLEKLKNIYESSKGKLAKDIDTFEKFIDWTIDIAIESHIQFSAVNNKMMDMLDSTISNSNFDLNNIDEFIHEVFAAESKELGLRKIKKDEENNKKSSNNKSDQNSTTEKKIKN